MGVNNGCQMNTKGCSKKTDQKLDTFDWLCDIPESTSATDLVEVTFKNTRKGYYRNTNDLTLEKGDIVAVEATPGHDIGVISMTGQLVLAQMKKYHIDQTRTEIKRVYRKVRPNDMEKYEEFKAKEHDTMLKARKIAEDLNLNMKIGDVEYQGDGNKAIFYYIADERVDFRELIKVLADTFHVRIEMKQIGARQEAGRIGGIGPCGRALCCSSWMTKFSSVATSSARYQEISLNPQKLAGQCAKLKCCLNFEIDAYVEAQKSIPDRNIPLETLDGTFYHFKTDVFGGIMQYSSAPNMAANIVSIPVDRVKEIIALNKQGIKVESLLESTEEKEREADYDNVVGQDSLTRFDKKKKKKKNKGNNTADASSTDQPTNQQNQSEVVEESPKNEETDTTEDNAAGNNDNAAPTNSPRNEERRDRRNNDRRRDRNNRRDRDRRSFKGNEEGDNNASQDNASQNAPIQDAPIQGNNPSNEGNAGENNPNPNQENRRRDHRDNRRRNFDRRRNGNNRNEAGNNNGQNSSNGNTNNNANPQSNE